MTLWLDVLLVLLILTSFWLLGSSRLRACIQAVAMQGVVLGLIPLFAAWPILTTRLVSVAVLSIIVKAIVLPTMLRRAAREANVRYEVQPLIGFTTSLLAGIVLWGLAMYLSQRLPVTMLHVTPLLVPVSVFTILCGFLLIVSRNTALMQVIGYLALENGIYVFGWAFAIEEPLIVEMGVLLDVFVAVFVMGIMIYRLSREFDTIETDELDSLKE